jgi:hypothetical protein
MNEEQEEKFSDDPNEHFKIENEILKMKLKAQFGDAFQMFTGNEALPPEVENKFLKSIINIEENFDNIEFIRIADKIGNPTIKNSKDVQDGELQAETERVMDLLHTHNINLDFLDGPYDERLVYNFITEELLEKEVEKDMPEGMTCNFIYEEFHPNHDADIKRLSHEFIVAWVTGQVENMESLLAETLVDDKGNRHTKEHILVRIKNIFDAFVQFKDDGYNIYDVGFSINSDGETGMGHAEGALKFDAVMENGEILHFEGPFKLYLSLQYNYWNLFYFIIPGFKWSVE